jgi:hypothetical protein
MSFINQVGNSLTGLTGTGNFVGANTPTLITPNIGVATGTSLTFSPTTNGIVGTTTNNSASAGFVGEYISATSGSPVSLTTATGTNLTSISVTAGDWDIAASVSFAAGDATTLVQAVQISSSTTSTSIQSLPYATVFTFGATGTAIGSVRNLGLPLATVRYSLSTTTTIYLVTVADFSVSTLAASGYIQARRVR